jgi:preprotein translocase subunit SecD
MLIMLAVSWGGLVAVLSAGLTPKLGLDLRGGTSVLLDAPAGTDIDVVETAVAVMRRRIEDFGSVQEPEISISQGQNGDISVLVQLPGVTDQERALDAIGQTGQLSFRPVIDSGIRSPLLAQADASGADFEFPEGVDPTTGLTIVDDPTAATSWVAEHDESGNPVFVYEVGPVALDGSDVAGALALFGNQGGGQWTVQLTLTGPGGDKFAAITRTLALAPIGSPQRQMAIVLDGVVVSAPQVSPEIDPNVGIDGGTAIITVGASDNAQVEANGLATVLRYGSLPVAFERSAVQKVSATLGADSLQAGLIAGLGGLVLVVGFLLIYYRALGMVTVLGLTVFAGLLLVVFGLLGRIQGLTLTLAGVAGIIVSVGITSDSYIVFFERLKEEVSKGRTIEEAADEGFKRVFRTILTADFVSLIGAVVLWALAVGPVKGFAQALGIATVLDVIVAYYFTRNAVALLARSRFAEHGWFSIRAATGERGTSQEVLV